jgi:arginine/lysine/ornithine decarboxylase
MDPVFTEPAVVPGFNFAAGVPVAEVYRTVRDHPDACAVLCVHPTYYGAAGDIRTAAGIVHGAGMPLLADEAHGSHLYFHPGYPEGALGAGADAAVQSMHKTGGSLTQSALLHLKGALLDREKVFSAVKLLQTSSPSYVLMASLDAARKQLAVNGFELLQGMLEEAAKLRDILAGVRGLDVFGPGCLDGDGVFDFDPARIIIRVSGLGLTGWQAAGWLRRNHGICVEMADRDNIVLVMGLGVAGEECRSLAGGIKDLAEREGTGFKPVPAVRADIPAAKMAVKLREAWFAPARQVKLGQAAGMVCAEWVASYPPGIPVLVPGEEVSAGMVNYLIELKESGACFQGPADSKLDYLRVIDF